MGSDLSATGVLIVDRHVLFRRGLMGLLHEARPDWRLAEFGSLEQMRNQIHSASLVILDSTLPDLNGIDGIRQLHADFPSHSFVIVSDSDDRDTVLGCLAAGAQGCLSRASDPTQVLRALDIILEGGIYAPARNGATITASAKPATMPRSDAALSGLTERQRDVLRLLAEGCATKTIARRLDLGVGTVKVHLAAIYRALGARSRLEAVAKMHRAYA